MKSLLVERLLESTRKYSEKIAIVDEDGNRCTTYGEMYSLALKVTAYIRKKEIPARSFVCVRMDNCMEFMAAELGIWLAGCIAVPIGMNYPQERVDAITGDCDHQLFIDKRLMDDIKRVTGTGSVDPARGQGDMSLRPIVPENTDVAILLYTSGSTGKPKGILLPFEPFDYSHTRFTGFSRPSEEQVYGCSAPFYFVAIELMFNMLMVGATVHIYSNRVKTDAQALSEYITEHGITVSHIPPALLLHFHNTSDTLKAVLTAGEKITTQHSQEGYTLYILYGMTEAAGGVATYVIGNEPMERVPLGRCHKDLEYCIMKEDGSTAATGEEGELCLRGRLCKGYFKDPENTTRLFEGGWLHTKDVVVEEEDCLLYFKGRRDWMIKVNGQRVAPEEVESAMMKMNEVSNAVAKGFDNGRGSQYLCAFYIADRDIEAHEFKVFLDKLIPPYMHPAMYVRVDSFPLNANGKINRKALEVPKKDLTRKVIEPPKTDREYALLEIAQEVLGCKDFGVTDNLYELGMDSIRATQFVAMAADRNYTIKVNDIAKFPTIRQLSESSMSLLYWYNPYDDDKQIVVFACGAIGTHLLNRRMQSLAEHYNVLVVEPYYEHYTYIANDDDIFEEILGLYYDLLDIMVEDKTRIVGFSGFSFGGTVAYGLYRLYYQQTGRINKLVMGDAPIVFDKYIPVTTEEIERQVMDIAKQNPDETLSYIRIYHYGFHSIAHLVSEWSATPVPADVLLFRCIRDDNAKNLQRYYECFGEITIDEIDDHHHSFVLDKTGQWHELTIRRSLEFFSGLGF